MVEIVYEENKQRSAAYDGNINIGECTYVVRENIWIINHTFVEPNYGGQGIASKLVAKLVEEARIKKLKILPICQFAVSEFEKKSEYSDILIKR